MKHFHCYIYIAFSCGDFQFFANFTRPFLVFVGPVVLNCYFSIEFVQLIKILCICPVRVNSFLALKVNGLCMRTWEHLHFWASQAHKRTPNSWDGQSKQTRIQVKKILQTVGVQHGISNLNWIPLFCHIQSSSSSRVDLFCSIRSAFLFWLLLHIRQALKPTGQICFCVILVCFLSH